MNNLLDSKGRTLEEFLSTYDASKYPRPFLTADIILLSEEEHTKVLLVKRKNHPFIGQWALPGGFANQNETIEETASRELLEETGVKNLSFETVGIYSKNGRDPRGWVVSVAFKAYVNRSSLTVHADDDAADASWFSIIDDKLVGTNQTINLSDLAFDHKFILVDAIKKAPR